MATPKFGSEVLSQMAQKIVLVFLGIAFYNVIELTFIILTTFKRHAGLYFWSFFVASWGIPFYNAGFLIKYFAPPSLSYMAATFISVGWVAMVTGQSLVLWSRLHLVLRNSKRLRMVLWMIIIDAILMHCTVIPLIYGSFSSRPEGFARPYSIMEKVQVTVFFLQEIVISGFYIFETVKLMKLEQSMGNRRSSRRLMNHLIYVNICIILLDVTILGLEYADQYQYQTAYKAFVYSTKLKLEFTILNRLVEMTTGKKDLSSGPRSRTAGTSTTNHKRTNIGLDTFISERGTRPRDVEYQAYAMGGEESRPGEADIGTSALGHDAVVMTTEVIVQREDRRDDESLSDGRISRKSSSAESTLRGQGNPFEDLSKSSSEVN